MSKSANDSREFLADIWLPILDNPDKYLLELPITAEEMEQAIFGLKSGKALVQNGVPASQCKPNVVLAPRMLQMFQQSKQEGTLPRYQ